MQNINVLDCTLRDGGNVNNWDFGRKNIGKILKSLSKSKVDIIEIGHFKKNIRDKNKTLADNIEYFNELSDYFLCDTNSYITVMTRPDLFDIKNISDKQTNHKVAGIRFAFYPYHIDELKEQVKVAKAKGYDVFLNPIGISCQNISEIKTTLEILNKLSPKGVSIVDSFGALEFQSFNRIHNIFDQELDKDISLGIHLHENKGISFSLACQFIEHNNNKRKIIIDSSLQGIGRVPGNLCSEVIMNNINIRSKNKYNLLPIYEIIDNVISPIKENVKWGYLPHYYLSALANINRHYAEFFYEEKGISLKELPELFEKVKKFEPTGLRFSKEICEKVLNMDE